MSSPGGVVQSARDDPLDVERVREQFPALHQEVHGQPLVYLDNAATTHKPQRVIDAVARHDSEDNANVHRGVHQLSQRATDAYETARERVAGFLGADDPGEIVFTRGTTEAINLVAQSYGASTLEPGDEILLTELEHHSNIVPWQQVAETTGAEIRVAPIDDDGDLRMDAFEDLLDEATRIVAVSHVSNALGTVNPVTEIAELAHEHDARVLVDGAQAAPHLSVDVEEIGCDFYAISGHKVYGPTGIGALYGRAELLDEMPPYQGGGEMIRTVTFDETSFADPPQRFEAGTPNITGAVGLGEALAFVEETGPAAVRAHEDRVLEAIEAELDAIDAVTIVGRPDEKAGVCSFVIDGIHPHDVGTVLDRAGVAIRAGHHCAQPVMDHFDVPATARASVGVYNTVDEAPHLADAVTEAIKMFE